MNHPSVPPFSHLSLHKTSNTFVHLLRELTLNQHNLIHDVLTATTIPLDEKPNQKLSNLGEEKPPHLVLEKLILAQPIQNYHGVFDRKST